jgi:heptosyltransferase I
MNSATMTATPAPRRVLIVLLGAIGDVVRALPLLGRIRRAWPQAFIAWAVEPKSEPILRHHRWLDQLIIYDRKYAPWSFMPFLAKVRDGRFDLVIDLQRHLKSGVISLVSGAHERLGFAAVNCKEWNNLFSTRRIEPQPRMRLKLMQYQAFADALGLAPAPIEFGLSLDHEERRQVMELLAGTPRPLLGIILGSSWPSRLYPLESAVEVVRLLCSSGEGASLFPVLIGGKDEMAQAAQMMSELGNCRAVNLTGRTTVRSLIGIFSECAVAFGPDSGPMHIAAAVGCPVVSLWGSTAPERSAPWGFAELALRGEIPCHPCYLRKCPIGGECMRRISPATVVSKISSVLSSRDRSLGHISRLSAIAGNDNS